MNECVFRASAGEAAAGGAMSAREAAQHGASSQRRAALLTAVGSL